MEEEFELGYKETKWDKFFGETVCVRLSRENYHGTVKHASREHGAVYLQPSLVNQAGNKGLRIEYNLPIMVPFDGCIVSPVKEGMEEVEAYARNYNAALGIAEDVRDQLKDTIEEEFDFYGMRTKWDVFSGKAVFTRILGDNYWGVVRGIFQDQDAVHLQPSVVYNAAGNRFNIVTNLPTMVPFNVQLVVPLRGVEDLGAIVKYYNTSREAIEAQEAAKRQKQ